MMFSVRGVGHFMVLLGPFFHHWLGPLLSIVPLHVLRNVHESVLSFQFFRTFLASSVSPFLFLQDL